MAYFIVKSIVYFCERYVLHLLYKMAICKQFLVEYCHFS